MGNGLLRSHRGRATSFISFLPVFPLSPLYSRTRLCLMQRIYIMDTLDSASVRIVVTEVSPFLLYLSFTYYLLYRSLIPCDLGSNFYMGV